jgi:hypothetical protein
LNWQAQTKHKGKWQTYSDFVDQKAIEAEWQHMLRKWRAKGHEYRILDPQGNVRYTTEKANTYIILK